MPELTAVEAARSARTVGGDVVQTEAVEALPNEVRQHPGRRRERRARTHARRQSRSLTLVPNDLNEPIRVHPRARGAPGVRHEATRDHDRRARRGRWLRPTAQDASGRHRRWGRQRRARGSWCGGGGSPPPTPSGAARAKRPGGGGCDLESEEEEEGRDRPPKQLRRPLAPHGRGRRCCAGGHEHAPQRGGGVASAARGCRGSRRRGGGRGSVDPTEQRPGRGWGRRRREDASH
jgi:hypothetical protein